jgi:hypothetical protein
MGNTATVYLKPYLTIGRSQEPYRLQITETGNVVITYENYPYSELIGFASFGINANLVGGASEIDCDSLQLLSAYSHITVKKESLYSYDTVNRELLETRHIRIDAHKTCGEVMEFEQISVES